MSESRSGSDRKGGTADYFEDGETVRRSVTVRRPQIDVEQAWRDAGITGEATFSAAPGDLGTEVRVVAPRQQQSALKEIIGAFTGDDPGESLSTQLRAFKAQLETGEVATTHGQPSGRERKSQ
ncbi:MAG TPA: hypothetical protein VK636_02410 [Gemmatimonadaceae bacterium]|nr:hypothetical protein [Gemmatimonadaceae bacterium]